VLGFMVSGAFLGFVYLDVIYQMIGLTVVLKVLLRKELQTQELESPEEVSTTAAFDEVAATV